MAHAAWGKREPDRGTKKPRVSFDAIAALSGPSREAFRAHRPVDEGTWARGRGWALWKALITHAEALRRRPHEAHLAGLSFGWRHSARSVIDDLLAEHQRHL
jgi:hypothetical protein